jgi:nucleotide-binding universal stress UspA family protein
MYQSILTPLDGSTFSEYALPLARTIAHRANAALKIALVHVPVAMRYVEGTAIFDEELDKRLKEHERGYLDGIVERLRSGTQVSITSSLIDGNVGKVADALNDYATSVNVDLVVMATHGRGALSRFWLGSVADQFVRHALTPILLVRPPEKAGAGPDLSHEQIFRHILIPLDGSPLAEQVLEHTVALGKLMNANYTLLRVIEPMIPLNYPSTQYSAKLEQEFLDRERVEAETYLKGITDRLQTQTGGGSLQIHTKVVTSRNPATAIIEESRKNDIDLITMETHGFGGLTRLLLGSVADKVLRSASLSMLLHRPHGEAS